MSIQRCAIWMLLALLAVPAAAFADAIVIGRSIQATTIMEAFIDRTVVRVELEVGLSDVPAFVNLLPDELYERLDRPPAPEVERRARFFAEDLVFAADGVPLPGRLLSIEPRSRVVRDAISGEPLPVPEETAEPVLFFVLEYALASSPATLRFKLPDRDQPGATASIGFVVYHLGVAVNDFRFLTPGATLDLDWSDPWHSRFRMRQMRRSYDAPMNVFLYIEPYEVRVEVVLRPLDAEHWVDLGLSGRETITAEMYGDIKGRIAGLLEAHLQLTIDGDPAELVLDRIHFLRRTLRASTVIDPPEELSVFNAQIGAVFVTPRDGLPEEAALTWELFGPGTSVVPAAATDEAGPLPSTLTPDDNVLSWKNFLQNPTIPTMMAVEAPPHWSMRLLRRAGWAGVALAVLLVVPIVIRLVRTRSLPWATTFAALTLGAAGTASIAGARHAAVDETRTQRIVGTLLHNVYRSFDHRKEEAIYDALARSLEGDLLTRAYLETRRSLELASQGGARVKVNEVDVVECRARPAADGVGFTAECRWTVSGSVGHWGHLHQRTNQYQALLTVLAIDGAWRITQLDLLAEERL